MRISLLLFLAVALSSAVHAQQTASLDSRLTYILGRMQDPDTATRETAFNDLSQLWVEGIPIAQRNTNDSGIEGYRHILAMFFARHPDQAERVKLDLIRLLTTETNAMKANQTGSGTEDYGEYFFSVTQAVSALKDDRAIPALAGTISSSGVDLLQYGDKALGPILAVLKSTDALVRARAFELAARLLDAKKDEASRARLEDLIRSSLKDPAPVVRRAVTQEIVCFDHRQDYVPTLEQIAKTDAWKLPGKADDGGDGDEFYPVRADARRALRDIQANKPCSH